MRLLRPVIYEWRANKKYDAWEEGTECGWRKQPIVTYWNSTHAAVTGETSCQLPGSVWLQWKQQTQDSIRNGVLPQTFAAATAVHPIKYAERHYVYRGAIPLDMLPSGVPGNSSVGPIDITFQWSWAHDKDADTRLTQRHLIKANEQYTLPSENFMYLRDIPTVGGHGDSTQQTDMRIALIADNQYNAPVFQDLVYAIAKHKPHAWVHAGDAVQNPESLRDWETDFYEPVVAAGMNNVPLLYARGNHDDVTDYSWPGQAESERGRIYHQAVPSWFAVTLGGARWIILDALRDSDPNQDQFLLAELAGPAAAAASFVIVVVHVPPYIEFWCPKGWANGERDQWGPNVRLRWAGWFEEHRVDLVISGHQHNYQRGKRHDTTYTIVGGGGGMLDRERVEDWHMYERTVIDYHYVMLTLTSRRLHWSAYSATGKEIDTFNLEKRR
ncbi:Metallo-dependent phosphatase-like protein [Thamnocephalis sphaerospora]|uniref:Metallo-dependent phosphatase-like protein n=1 Tax=Thamnocephalis sphaerospora TaxID=78915 RepID=A0A4P9XN02_9FUNG|nr:Metallo-dependent phosphatase-like protein [Thamnocephalis sphaerospora]|eukprot:RKP07192.1 Metallo-dependent phosphatase-like protein [Thamnocephalis sphaerospora]